MSITVVVDSHILSFSEFRRRDVWNWSQRKVPPASECSDMINRQRKYVLRYLFVAD